MGDPKRLRKKYSTPSHPWQKQRIDEEKELLQEYGFKNKKELWKLNSKLRTFRNSVKKLITQNDEISIKEKANLILKLHKLGVVGQDAVLEDILGVTIKDLCDRRLQTIVFKKGLARSSRQARQFITHEHILVGDRKITFPSFLVNTDEELMVVFSEGSNISNEDHPERVPADQFVKDEMKKAGLDKPKEKDPKKDVKEFVEKMKDKKVVPEEKPKEELKEKVTKDTEKVEKVEETKEQKPVAVKETKEDSKENVAKDTEKVEKVEETKEQKPVAVKETEVESKEDPKENLKKVDEK
jgi:small subunit ribosomal protein S4